MAPVEFVLVAPDTSIKRNKNEKIEIAVAISHFDRVFLLQFSLVFARWNRRLAHESIPSNSLGNCRLSACCLNSFVEPLLIDEIGNKPTDDRSLTFW